MNSSIKQLSRLLALLIIVTPQFSFHFDAPVEEFLVPASKIHPKALSEVKGVLTVTFSELDYFTQLQVEPAKMQAYSFADTTGMVPLSESLSAENTKALSGIDYSGMIIRRFAIVNADHSRVQIIYNMETNLRAWVQIVDQHYVRTSVGQLIPAHVFLFNDATNLSESFDLFYLLNGKARMFYQTADETSAKILVPNTESFNKIPWRERDESVSSVEASEIQNGFLKVYTRHGVDGELLFAGWVKIFEGRQLTVWQFETRGC